MPLYRQYFRSLYDVIESVIGSQSPQVETVAGWMADSLAAKGVVHLFGSGHSHIIAEEVFHRAGSLLPLNPILDINLTLLSSLNATKLERSEGYGRTIADSQDIRPGEVVFVISNSGVNPVPIDFAQRCHELGAKTVAITSAENYRDRMPSRHSSGRHLADMVALTIDTHVPFGDALIELPGKQQIVGGVSTAVGIALINAIVVETTDILLQRGIDPPVIPSMNVPDGDAIMERLVAEYGDRLPLLRRA
jgi:uncharacterized phosphosugar-binding protein